MKKRDLTNPLAQVTFWCATCFGSLDGEEANRKRGYNFKAAPARVADLPEQEHHPYAYFAPCPICERECEQWQPERALLKAWVNATGPRTEEGKAATARNLEGHPTPEEALRTRFNAMKHGLSARTARYFPSKPDGYSFCAGCDVDRDHCAKQPACEKQLQLFMLHQAAFDQRNPKHLMPLYADLHAAVFGVVQQILQTIIKDGATLVAPQWYKTDHGVMVLAEYEDKNGDKHIIKEVQAHPLFKPLGELISRVGISLTDIGMTQRVLDDEQEELGRIQQGEKNQTLLRDFMQQQSGQLQGFRLLVEQAAANRARDPLLIEHQAQGDT